MKPLACLLALLLASLAISRAQAPAGDEAVRPVILDSNSWPRIDEALHLLNCTRLDAGFNKDVITNLHWSFEPVRDLLDHPFDLNDVAENLLHFLQHDPPLAAAFLSPGDGARSPAIERDDSRKFIPRSSRISPALRQLMESFHASANIRGMEFPSIQTSGLSSLLFSQFDTISYEQQQALMKPLGLGDDGILKAQRALLDPKPAAMAQFEAGTASGPLVDLAVQGELLSDQIEQLIASAITLTNWPAKALEIAPGWYIGSEGPDVYTSAYTLVLDPGGNDRYEGFAGTAHPNNQLAITIDLAGDDIYQSDQLLGAGAAIAGYSMLIDLAGDDVYRADHMGQGAAICGYARHEDRAGDDLYQAGNVGQGAAMHGMAILSDHAGRDRYVIGQCGQGFAGVRGIGSLIDRSGDDSYLAHGLAKVPWYPNQKFTMAQGFAIGDRPFVGGGMAALIDLAGNDVYKADVYGQGVSYWYSLGILYDRRGNDSYSMFHYGQGSGIHLSTGLLVDGDGKDTYLAGEGLAQGNAHDYAIGWLIDKGNGRDQYTADHFCQGRGMNNSFAMLLDEGGADSYYARQLHRAQGVGDNGRYREYGSLCLLLDLQGVDNYSFDIKNGDFVRRPDHGIIYDWPDPPRQESK